MAPVGATGEPKFEPLGGVAPIVCDPAAATVGSPRIWRLTRIQYDKTVAALLGDDSQPARAFLPEPGSEQGFQNDSFQLRVRSTEASQFRNAAKTLAQEAVASSLDSLFPCDADMLEDATCQRSFIEEFGAKAFRRPLSDAEVSRYLELYQLGTEKGDGELGITVTLEAMLQSPYFLYRFELGDFNPNAPAATTLTEYEAAAALSYYITNGPPDEHLTAAAAAGELQAPEGRRTEAARLLESDAAKSAIVEFFAQLLEYKGLPDVMKDPDVFPEFDYVREAMQAELEHYVTHVVFAADGSWQTLMTADYTFANEELADYLGLSASGDDFQRVATDPSERKGLLALSGFNAVLSAQTRTSPVNRGRFVRDRLLCEHIADPPEGVDLELPKLEEGLTARQQLDAKTSPPACAGCHRLMNPVGFGMEKLDAVGRFRTEENGLPIDDSSELTGTRDIDGAFQGVPELASKLAASEQVQECVTVQAYRYALGRPENQGDACSVAAIRDDFFASGSNLHDLFTAIVAHPSFVQRR